MQKEYQKSITSCFDQLKQKLQCAKEEQNKQLFEKEKARSQHMKDIQQFLDSLLQNHEEILHEQDFEIYQQLLGLYFEKVKEINQQLRDSMGNQQLQQMEEFKLSLK